MIFFIREPTIDHMKSMTPPVFCEFIEDDLLYMSYKNMEWTLYGQIEQYNLPTSEVCIIGTDSVTILLKSNSETLCKVHQASSSIIKHHQASSSIIKRHQVSSSIINHHQA